MDSTLALNRRDFLLLRLDAQRNVMELSCERLMMRYVDAKVSHTTQELFARLDRELQSVREVRLVEAAWLGREDFASELERVLRAFRGRGGRVMTDSV
jgi:hypothetical protein